jgi:hypothetical protein
MAASRRSDSAGEVAEIIVDVMPGLTSWKVSIGNDDLGIYASKAYALRRAKILANQKRGDGRARIRVYDKYENTMAWRTVWTSPRRDEEGV